MKVSGYKVIPLQLGIQALHLSDVELPLADILERSIVGVNSAGQIPEFVDQEGHRPPVRFQVKPPGGGVLDVHGFLLYSRVETLVDFLLNHYAPSGRGRVDEILQGAPREKAREELVAHVRRRHGEVFEGPYYRPRRRAPVSEFIVHRDQMDLSTLILQKGDGHCLRRSESRVALVAEAAVPYGEHSIPRAKFAVALGVPNERRFLWFDGARAGCTAFADQIPAPLVEELDASGRSTADGVKDPLPPPPLLPIFLLRAPSKKEAARHAKGGIAGEPAPGRPFFLVDTRRPLAIPPGLEVVSDVKPALAILSRVCSDVYVPRDILAPLANLGDEPRWFLACRVAG